MAPFAVAVITKLHEFTSGVFTFEIAAGDVVEHDASVFEVLCGKVFLNRRLALEETVQSLITMFIDVYRALHSAEFPQGRGAPAMGKREFAALEKDASNDHGEHVLDPAFPGPGVEHFGQADVMGEIEQGHGAAQFAAFNDAESPGIIP